jgi:hypothetical protein
MFVAASRRSISDAADAIVLGHDGQPRQAAGADQVQITVDASSTGAKIDRNSFGQFAEHLGTGVYDGVWVGPTRRSRFVRNFNPAQQKGEGEMLKIAVGPAARGRAGPSGPRRS